MTTVSFAVVQNAETTYEKAQKLFRVFVAKIMSRVWDQFIG
jgi:hypothetical protein